MTTRYGDKTEVGNPVTNWGRGVPSGGSTWTMTEQVFTSPGTWTKPATVTQVEVIVVGGGGGGGANNNTSPFGTWGGGGGGGGVRTAIVPVSGPVPVTVGAGGAGGFFTPTNTPSQPGGTSAFGPLGPGPIPLIPAPTIAAGGGGGGASFIGPEANLPPVPTIGGGAGGIGDATFYPAPARVGVSGGLYGYPSASNSQTTPGRADSIGGAGAGDSNIGRMGGRGKLGFGFGAPSTQQWLNPPASGGTPAQSPSGSVGAFDATAGAANTGNGGGAGGSFGPPAIFPAPLVPTVAPAQRGAAGGSGVVIVRYWSS